MRKIAALVASIGVVCSTSLGSAAQLTEIKGTVMVDVGQGFVPAAVNPESPGLELKIGDRVLVAKEGQALLVYSPDCSMPLSPPSMTTVVDAACSFSTADLPADLGDGAVGAPMAPVAGAGAAGFGLPQVAAAVVGIPLLVAFAIVAGQTLSDDDDGDGDEARSP